jgi:hypothetical protein
MSVNKIAASWRVEDMQIRYEILISNTRTARYARESYLNELSSKKTKEKHVRGGFAAKCPAHHYY